MAKTGVGKQAPNVTLLSVDEKPVELASMWGNGQHALLIFLRHLA